MNKIYKFNDKTIQFISGIHGDEPIPIFALANLGIKQIVGNPKALIKNKRFIEKDLNSCFGIQGSTYEEIRAKKITKLLKKSTYVVDLHTTSAVTGPFVIIVDKKMLSFASIFNFPIVYMKFNIKNSHSLINYCNGVSIEVGRHKKIESLKNIQRIIKSIANAQENSVEIYEVFDKITKPGEYLNFKLYNKDFYPILAGEKAYDFFGLKARKLYKKGGDNYARK